MAGVAASQNPLLSDKPPETPLTIQLHPLVLLTISDYVTRHTLRGQQGPIVGAVIGQQDGRSLTLEHAYECLVTDKNGTELDQEFFQTRLDQYKEVHKEPPLDLVALFMLGPRDGPQPEHVPILQQTQKLVGSESVMLLLFHPEEVELQEGGKLPISLYEAFEAQHEGTSQLRFVERPFDVETGEAEMIGVDFVAKGGGNASAVGGQSSAASGSTPKDKQVKSKGKAKDKEGEKETNGIGTHVLSNEDEELIASLNAKANAIKMLNQRLNLIRAYLLSLPKSSLTSTSETAPPPADTNFAVLRNINAMLSRLPLLTSTSNSDDSSLQRAALRQRQDVHLTSLLAALTQSVAEAQGVGSRFNDVVRERSSKERATNMLGRAPPDSMDTSKP